MDIEVPESKTLVIQKEATPQIKYKKVVNFENETFDAKIFADFPLELDKLLSWVGYRKNVRELKDWNIFKPRDVAQANVTGLRHSEKARILLNKAKDHGIGIWNYDKTLFCIFEDLVLN